MAITVEAVYENGVLKPSEPLPFKEGQKVLVAVTNLDSSLLKAYGIIGWKGTSEELARLLAEIEFDEDRCVDAGQWPESNRQ
jgi:predicted DNA-binding antitoxin AbrB/MazE fold protein